MFKTAALPTSSELLETPAVEGKQGLRICRGFLGRNLSFKVCLSYPPRYIMKAEEEKAAAERGILEKVISLWLQEVLSKAEAVLPHFEKNN